MRIASTANTVLMALLTVLVVIGSYRHRCNASSISNEDERGQSRQVRNWCTKTEICDYPQTRPCKHEQWTFDPETLLACHSYTVIPEP